MYFEYTEGFMCSLRFSLQRRQIQISMLAFDKSMFAAMAFYLLKIHKGIQIMSKNAGAQKIAGTPCTRMLGKSPVCQNSGVGKKGEMSESCQQRQQWSKTSISNRKQKILSSRCSLRVCQHTRESINQKELLVWGLSPVGVEPTTDCLGERKNVRL